MTVQKAIEMLKARLECVVNLTGDKCSYSSCADCHLCCEQGSLEEQKEYLDIAIKALEAWGNVREEIEFIQEAEEQVYGKASWGFSRKCLDVIDKHLAEAENDV